MGARRRLKIALVGGDSAIRDAARKRLASGFALVEICEGPTGTQLERADALAPDCVVLIDEPPVDDVVAMLRSRAADELLRRSPIVVVTEDRNTRRASLRAGATACAEGEATLARAIEDAIDRFAAGGGERIRRFADGLPAFVSYIDADQRYVFLNEFYSETFSRPASELVGESVAEVLGPENYAIVEPQLAKALAGQAVRAEERLQLPDFGARHFQANYLPDRRADGSVAGCFVMVVDITPLEQAEQLVRESEERLRTAKEAAGFGIHDYEVRTGALTWDERVRELWGVGPDEPVDGELFLAGVHPDDRERVDREFARVLDPASDGHYRIEHRVIGRDDGRLRWVAVVGRVTFVDGQPVRAVGTIHDITRRKLAEAELRLSRERLRELDRRKDEFLAMLGHELRNPLAAIRSASELLHIYTGADPRLTRIAEVLERQSKHMVRLIDGLLEVSRIARGKVALEWMAVDLRGVLAGVLVDRGEQIASSGLTLSAPPSEQALWVWGDEVRLAQIFDNLLGNAIKFTAAPGTIEVSGQQAGDRITVTVTDTGVGVQPELLEAIFEPFQQAEHEIARLSGGLGIGLSLVRGLVELHQGRVIARSEGPGRGAVFEVELPALASSSRASATSACVSTRE